MQYIYRRENEINKDKTNGIDVLRAIINFLFPNVSIYFFISRDTSFVLGLLCEGKK